MTKENKEAMFSLKI